MMNRVGIAIIVISLFMPFLAQAAERDKFLDIQKISAPNGVAAWLVEDHSIPVISIEFAFSGAGAVNDPLDKQGLSQLASNTLDEGAGDLDSDSFQGALLRDSISLSFNAGRDHFGGSLKTRTATKDQAFLLLKKALSTPRFDTDPVRRMKEANITRIKSSLSDPEWIGARFFNDVVYQGHPYALNSGGTLSTMVALDKTDLDSFVKNRLAQKNLKVGIAGDITKEEAEIALAHIFESLPKDYKMDMPAQIDIQNQGKTYLYKTDIPQTIIYAALPALSQDDPDYYAFQVMNQILGASGFGSRLTEELREKRGLTYGIYSSLQNKEYNDLLHIYLSTANKNVSEAMILLKQELQRMATEPVTESELNDAVSYINGSLPLTLSSTSNIASLLLGLQLDGRPFDYLDQRADAFNAVTIADIQRVAAKYLNIPAMLVIMVGKPDVIEMGTITLSELPNVE